MVFRQMFIKCSSNFRIARASWSTGMCQVILRRGEMVDGDVFRSGAWVPSKSAALDARERGGWARLDRGVWSDGGEDE